MAEAVRFARAEAMRRKLRVKLDVGADRDSYTLLIQRSDDTSGVSFTSFDRSFLEQQHRLPQGVRVNRIWQGERILDKPTLEFAPGGIMDAHKIELTGNQGHKAWIRIGPWIDEVAIEYETTPYTN